MGPSRDLTDHKQRGGRYAHAITADASSFVTNRRRSTLDTPKALAAADTLPHLSRSSRSIASRPTGSAGRRRSFIGASAHHGAVAADPGARGSFLAATKL